MSSEIIKVLKRIKISNYIYGIFIVVSLLGFYANKKTKDQVTNKDKNGYKKAHKTRVIILIIALIIYIYYLETRVEAKMDEKTSSFLENLNILSALLFLVGGILSLYTEIKGNEEIIITE